ncbi:choline dehydrogenase-like flavoprotein [Gibbsiella quercinecans]|uniref:Choline dehydrogenase n=1 Tax=Gibbsiella quercinecans TaxID=929813 RepID=A0A250B6T4_9GAMM|nr:GMC family oxidoreductase [Gibbsiella quercinecans]ATA21642.1 choline dehydrogenase [Gibbsiella quercinecans]RLM06100.1 choline dehydrogenase [Gibbsiella quercinecans]RLM06256.1 choline dehydrogenase [Gibbsiella quercinecans]TCT88889.1 choline dehydrogenase-like flavoprotein [Gibbsiella quercinecans]
MSNFDADVIIIGSGALGANAAYQLAKAGKSVIMLEAGPYISRWKVVENYRNSASKRNWCAPYPNLPWAPNSYTEGYVDAAGDDDFQYVTSFLKVAGGSTRHWASACWRLLPNDFKLKSVYGVGRDWPIAYADLEPWYLKAEREIGVVGTGEEDQSGQGRGAYPPRSAEYPLPPEAKPYMVQRMQAKLGPLGYQVIHEPHARVSRPYDGRPACAGNNNCEPVCPIGAMYSGDMHVDKAVALGVDLRTESVAYRLEKGPNNRIVAVHYRKPDGSDTRLTARYFILAAHGLETPKLLLMSDVANSSDQVGRNLMDHTGLSMTFLADEPLWTGRGSVQHGTIANRRDEASRAQHSAIRYSLRNLVPNVDVTPPLLKAGIMGPALDEAIRDRASRIMNISTMSETLPDPNNRVQPNYARRDAIGLPMLKVNYHLDSYVRGMRPQAYKDFANFLQAFGGDIIEAPTGWRNQFHIMGTVIMGSNPADSVVDADCRTHDHPNLFLATTGVMPTSATVNPTLTGIALALRMADTIIREM